jgi:hypothetical protein
MKSVKRHCNSCSPNGYVNQEGVRLRGFARALVATTAITLCHRRHSSVSTAGALTGGACALVAAGSGVGPTATVGLELGTTVVGC